jgi:hypothetical protein
MKTSSRSRFFKQGFAMIEDVSPLIAIRLHRFSTSNRVPKGDGFQDRDFLPQASSRLIRATLHNTCVQHSHRSLRSIA